MLGAWTRLRGQLTVGPIALRGSIAYGSYGSIEHLDRFEERVTRDVHGTEDVLEIETAARLRLVDLVDVGAGFRQRQRDSSLADVSLRRWDDNFYFSTGLSF